MKQENKKPSPRESWWDIGFEGNGGVKSKKQDSVIVRENVMVLYLLLQTLVVSCFLHHHCMPSNPIFHQLSHRELFLFTCLIIYILIDVVNYKSFATAPVFSGLVIEISKLFKILPRVAFSTAQCNKTIAKIYNRVFDHSRHFSMQETLKLLVKFPFFK